MAALFLSATGARAEVPEAEAKLRVFKPVCALADAVDVQAAVEGASALLQERCRLRLRWQGVESLPLESPWCHLPMDRQERAKALPTLAAKAKARRARDLALFLLPSSADTRLSWALVDTSLRSACNSPQETRFLARFGSLFFTDVTWMEAAPRQGATAPSLASLLVAHEVLHALTQRAHPTDAPRGSIMADHVADIGPQIDPELCACARRSPYVSLLRRKR